MRDAEVRRAFHHTILKSEHQDCQTLVVDELGLKNGQYRADIAVFNGHIVGYEIKTERDTLKRLEDQVLAYNDVFDKIFIVTSNNHLSEVLTMVPRWWGVYLIEQGKEGTYHFILYRPAKANKLKDTYTLAQLLWKQEALELAKVATSGDVKSWVTKDTLYDILAFEYNPNRMSELVIHYLKARDGWRRDRQLL